MKWLIKFYNIDNEVIDVGMVNGESRRDAINNAAIYLGEKYLGCVTYSSEPMSIKDLPYNDPCPFCGTCEGDMRSFSSGT